MIEAACFAAIALVAAFFVWRWAKGSGIARWSSRSAYMRELGERISGKDRRKPD